MDDKLDNSPGSMSVPKDQDIESDTSGAPPMRTEDVEKIGESPTVDKETEKRLLRKLDMRIIPMVCWIYLMNFMDRGLKGLLHSLHR